LTGRAEHCPFHVESALAEWKEDAPEFRRWRDGWWRDEKLCGEMCEKGAWVGRDLDQAWRKRSLGDEGYKIAWGLAMEN